MNVISVQYSLVILEWRSLSSSLPSYGGSTFVHWGKSSCPMTSKQIYRGQVAVPDHGASGGGSNYMCLPADPEYHPNSPNNVLSATIFRVWYEIDDNLDKLPNLHRDSVPCAVCESDQRLTQLMMPAKTRCPTSDWVLEYSGFLMSSPTQYTNGELVKNYYRTSYICVDNDIESFAKEPDAAWSGSGLYLTKAECEKGGKLGTCPPYDNSKALACAVCTK